MESQLRKPAAFPRWLEWAREIQALAQIGNHYATNDWQQERYHRLMEIAAEIVSEHTGLDAPALMEIYLAQAGYATPKVDVRAAAFRDGKLLLVRERSDGGWTLPGGWADVGDAPAESAEREAWEEAGFRVKAHRLVGVYDGNRFKPLELNHAYKLVFLCEVTSGEATPSNETSEVAFFAEDEIPSPISANRTPLRLIQDAFAAFSNPDKPGVFD
jgi:ADP-ribose pyrophosphatase YjhB (NUDIX family)